MAKGKVSVAESGRRITETIVGIHPDHKTFHRLTFCRDGILRIERPWCSLISRKEMEVLEESPYPHRWLIWKIQEGNLEGKPVKEYWKPDQPESKATSD